MHTQRWMFHRQAMQKEKHSIQNLLTDSTVPCIALGIFFNDLIAYPGLEKVKFQFFLDNFFGMCITFVTS